MSKEPPTHIEVAFFERDQHDRTRRWLGASNLETLRHSTVLMIGAGAVGNEVCKNLGLIGIKKIVLVDPDKVAASNLNRCVFFRPEDHDKTFKVDAIAERLPNLATDTVVEPHPVTIQQAPDSVWDADLVLVGVDNHYARFLLNAKNLSLDPPRPIINGAMGKDFVSVEVLAPPHTACLVCSWSKDFLDGVVANEVRTRCDPFFVDTLPRFPMISFVTSVVGAVMAWEATRVLIGLKQWKATGNWQEGLEPALGRFIHYNLQRHETTTGPIMPNPRCSETFCREKRNQT
ncbi:MAG: ThiF family adenylyltransferase [Candidatus Hermodarchaeota archaeon]|jgi:molybdopterin/thiamine biosynthesis adenylyltransferase|nr:ThiF family adenylyltransferase [Candidatus Hermodarchaeota archaeon]